MDGIINVYKEAGFTSHDVVAKLRGILHQKKIGHTGTLDPAAVGVLPVCCGKATKVCELLTDQDKSYRAVCRLGVETDTQDMTGMVLREGDFSSVDRRQLEECMEAFLGDLMQIPPMYSACKVNGKKLYELAREGKTVERKPRPIHISSCHLVEERLSEGLFTLDVTCSKGTYIRTLCHDMGVRLGCFAAMESLVRTRVSVFSLEDALTLDRIEELAECGELDARVWSVDALFPSYSKWRIREEHAARLSNGNHLSPEFLMPFGEDCAREEEAGLLPIGTQILVYDEKGYFRAIYQREQRDFCVKKMF